MVPGPYCDSCACTSQAARFDSVHVFVQKQLPANTRDAALIFNCGHVRDPIPLLWCVQEVSLYRAIVNQHVVERVRV